MGKEDGGVTAELERACAGLRLNSGLKIGDLVRGEGIVVPVTVRVQASWWRPKKSPAERSDILDFVCHTNASMVNKRVRQVGKKISTQT